ncbi:MAG TPA: fatty acyl-AMP ligase [Gemmatimonadaceae bacterium]|nr:fatty acyl-AMP ligase [Gemmatimonadaceae bacterium]
MSALPGTLVDVLRLRADDKCDVTAYTFLVDGEREGSRITYGDLDRRARAIAVALADRGVRPGDRALLLYPPGLDFIAAFFGCAYAGVVAVPSFPPHPAQLARTLPRLVAVAGDAQLSAILSTREIVENANAMVRFAPILGQNPWIATDAVPSDAADLWRDPALLPDALAFLQYTSGSTASPKGVMVSHANLLHNLGYANYVEENDATSVSVSWLPVIHDMGLIEGVLEPAYAGYPAYLMAPASFLQRPIRWLRAITRYRATNSGGPNFAYDLCVRKINDAQREELDLDSWRVAYNGAEPIRADTLRAFHERFAPAGFRWRSFYPVYGLAEATLVVSSGRRNDEPTIHDADADDLARGELSQSTESSSARPLVACGPTGCDTRVVIVDPESCAHRIDGVVGEVWVSSPSVARGYWRNVQQTADVFAARLSNGEGPFLRTGDLGVLADGELIITGRLKDVLIVRGLKHYPQDLELTAERQYPALRAGCSAAFAIDEQSDDAVAIALEVDPRQLSRKPSERKRQYHEIVTAVRRAITNEYGIVLRAVSLLALGGMPKTSSGKLQRRACSAAFLDGSLDEVFQWTNESPETRAEGTVDGAVRLAV